MNKRLVVAACLAMVGALLIFWLSRPRDASSTPTDEASPQVPAAREGAVVARVPANPVANDESAPASPEPTDAEPAVTGHVRDASGEGVAGVKVFVYLGPGGVPDATSGADGAFRVRRVAKGKHRWQAEADDWAPATGEVESPGQLEIRVERGATLRGDLFDEDSHPVATEICVVSKDQQHQKFTESDAQGDFAVRGLPPGPFVVTARIDGDPIATASFQAASTGETVVHLRVTPGTTMSGTVVDQGGRPVQCMAVHAQLEGDRDDDHMSRCDGDGGFTLKHLKPGVAYRLDAMAHNQKSSQEIAPPVKAPATGLKVALEMKTTVRGRLVDARGTPITSFSIDFERLRAADGRFEVAADEQRTKMELSAKGFATELRTIDPNAGQIDWGDVVMSDGRTVMVTALDPAGEPVAGATAADQRTDHGENAAFTATHVFPSNEATTDASGRARLEHLPAVETAVWVTHPRYATVMKKLAPGQSALQVTMTPASSISGKVRDNDGSTLTFGQVSAEQPGQPNRVVMVQQNGNYRFEALAPGEWTVQAYVDGTRFSKPMKLIVAPGSQLEQDFSMMGGIHLTMKLQPPVDFDLETVVWLVEGDRSALRTAADVGKAETDATLLNSIGHGAWSSTQAQPGIATVLVLRHNDEVIQVTTGVFTVPARDGTVDVRLSEPREIPNTK